MRKISTYITVIIAIYALAACDSTEEDPVTGGTGSMAGGTKAGGTMAGGMTTGGMMAGGTMAGGMTAGEMPAGEVPAGEVPAGELPAGEMPAGEMPAGGGSMLMGACTNDADLGQLERLGESGISEAVGSCVGMCITAGSPGCPTCLSGTTGLSDECVNCFVQVTECTVMNCILQCAVAPESMDCAQCREDNCIEAFVACSGVEQ